MQRVLPRSGIRSPRAFALGLACALAALVPAARAEAVSFSGVTNYSVGQLPQSIASGDFNNDSTPDLVTSNSTGGNVSVLLGTGGGNFAAATNYSAGGGAISVATGLFNGDSNIDLAVANSTANNVSILLGTGTGSFGSATNFAVGTSPRNVVVGDFNNDSNSDLAVDNNGSNSVSILLGNGAGSFSATTALTPGTQPRASAVGEFNADTHPDLAVANAGSGNVSIFLGSGAGAFTGPTNITTGGNARAVAVGNFNGDASPDLAVANGSGSSVSVLLGSGGGAFGAATNYPVGTTPTSVAVADFTGDGNADLAVTNGTGGNNVQVLVGSGSGTFTSAGTTAVGNTPTWLVATDLNGGSYPDVAVANGGTNNVSVMLGKAEPAIATSASSANIGQSISDQATLSGGSSPTGTITFTAYGPDDATCASAPAFTSTPVAVSGNGSYPSPSFTPNALGAYRWVASYSGDTNNQPAAGACNDANESSTMSQATPSISTQAAGTVTVGQSISDQATLSGGSSPTGSITFKAYGPDDATCANAPAFTSDPVTVSGNDDYQSPAFAPTQVGVYRWVASYSGDASNQAATGACNDPNESSTVAQATPAIATQATGAATIGQSISDQATLSGGSFPTGTIVFRAYGPGDATCANAPAFTSSAVTVSGNGTYNSPSFTPSQVGSYRWIAAYSGDAANASATGACNDANEQTDISDLPTPSISTQATSSITIGQSISDQATLTGGSGPTGTIVFKAYGPSDSGCSNTPAFTSTPVAVTGAGTYGSPSFTPTAGGTYRWRAFYSGDANNNPSSGACGDSGEDSTVAKLAPAISTQATSAVTIGQSISDQASISAGSSPGGTIVFRAYDPGDTSCANPPAFVSSAVAVSGNDDYDSPAFTPSQAGTYRWRAFYSGDARNEAVSGACNDSGEISSVAQAAPAIASQAGPGIVGQSISDQATLSGGVAPTGTITFKAYGPNDSGCAKAPAFTSTPVTVSGNGGYSSPSFTPTQVGSYRWIASYSGDTNNQSVAGSCNTANETSTVVRATPSLVIGPPPYDPAGGLHGAATLAGGSNPGGTISFRLFGPHDVDCARAAVFSAEVPVSGPGTYATPAYAPIAGGVYRWVATYSGDAENAGVNGACSEAGAVRVPDLPLAFAINGVTHRKGKGMAKLSVSVPLVGSVMTSGRGVRQSWMRTEGAGVVSLPVRSRGKRRATLRRTGHAELEVAVVFTSVGGDTATRHVHVMLTMGGRR
jgi:hypothetical protein